MFEFLNLLISPEYGDFTLGFNNSFLAASALFMLVFGTKSITNTRNKRIFINKYRKKWAYISRLILIASIFICHLKLLLDILASQPFVSLSSLSNIAVSAGFLVSFVLSLYDFQLSDYLLPYFQLELDNKLLHTSKVDNPYNHADIFFKISFSWMSKLMRLGYEKYLDEDDLYELPSEFKSENNELGSTGDIVNLMSVDIIWSGPTQQFLALFELYQLLGKSMFVGVAIIMIMVPINSSIIKFQKSLQKKQMGYKDSRTKLISEILNAIFICIDEIESTTQEF
ncbi:hypothetical protein ACO0OL_002866 [Hanseniaspora opuntiae]